MTGDLFFASSREALPSRFQLSMLLSQLRRLLQQLVVSRLIPYIRDTVAASTRPPAQSVIPRGATASTTSTAFVMADTAVITLTMKARAGVAENEE